MANDPTSRRIVPGTGATSGQSVHSSAQESGQRGTKQDELRLLINSHTPIITVETTEEDRLKALLEATSAKMGVPLFTWSVITGLARINGSPIYHTDQPEQALANIAMIDGDGIFLLKDFARYCENDRISRRLRDISDSFRTARRSIVITGASMNLPPELESDSAPLHFGLPGAEELLSVTKQTLIECSRDQGFAIALDSAGIEQLARNLVGMTEEEAARTLRRCLLQRGQADAKLLSMVMDVKHEALRADGLLQVVRPDSSFTEVVGLKQLRNWIQIRRSALSPEGRKFGLVPPKGVLISGVQGCGKSLAARAVAGEWGVDLARLDVGALYDKYVGESEKRLRKTLELAEKLAPMVLWIDEIEKAFASAGTSGDADAGLSQRLLATFLTWMQDRKTEVFLAATSNNISTLPPEMLRKGRFDEIFFVDLPKKDVRSALFAFHLKKRERNPTEFDLEQLAAASEGFSGAEIEQAIIAGLYTAFSRKCQLTTQILLGEIQGTQPLSVTRSEEIQSLRAWAKSRAVDAD